MDPIVHNQQRFLAFLEHRVGSRAVAEEILQNALVRTLETGSAPADEEGMVAWFYRVLHNGLVDHFRRQAAEGRAVDRVAREPEEAQEDPGLRDAICGCLHGLLPGLKAEYAEVVRQVDLDERPVGEVAAQLGISPNNASVRLHRARQALKRELERACGLCATHGCLDCTCGGSSKRAPL